MMIGYKRLVIGLFLTFFLPATSAEPVISAISPDLMHAIAANAEMVKKETGTLAKNEITYSEDSVRWVSGFIDRNRDGDPAGLVDTIGSYLGEAIISNYGGKWIIFDGQPAVEIKPDFVVFPFSKVAKHFENGQEDSIGRFFSALPELIEAYDKK